MPRFFNMRIISLFCVAVILLLPAAQALAVSDPVIGIIIDDLGNNYTETERAIHLPGPVACSFLPQTPYAASLARKAHQLGKEVLLHLPMESVDREDLGPGGLTLHMTRHQFDTTVRSDLAAIPYVDGVNNHMGSLMTQHPGDMAWLMTILAQKAPLFFVDSRTTAQTVAYEIAREHGVPATWRDVFLDDAEKPKPILHQLDRLIHIAKQRGTAIAIGHPYAVTMTVLEKQLPKLKERGVRLVPIRTIIARQADETLPAKVTWLKRRLRTASEGRSD